MTQSSPRQGRVRSLTEKTTAVFTYYASLVGDAPYPSFTLAAIESDRPGGHSPPYFALLNEVVVGSPFSFRGDPVSFDDYPTFFLAHEVAHQWWGHAVGWKNYHEQWISEGFAQYFAALYAEKDLDASVMGNILRQMRRTQWRNQTGSGLPRVPPGPHPRGRAGVPSDHLQQGGNGPAHAAKARRRQGVLRRGADVLPRLEVQEGRDRRFSCRDGAGERARSEQLFRDVDLRDDNPDAEIQFAYRRRVRRRPFRAEGGIRSTCRSPSDRIPDRCDEEVVVALADKVTERTIPLRGAVRSISAERR